MNGMLQTLKQLYQSIAVHEDFVYLIECVFELGLKIKIISLFNLFLLLFMSPIILFQLTFTFIYSTFSNNFSVSAK